jgi:hypothetical protein
MLSHVEYPQAPQASSPGESRMVSGQPGGTAITGTSGPTVSVSGAEGSLIIRRVNEQEWRDERDFVRPTFEGAELAILKHASGTEILLNQPAAKEVQSLLQTLRYLRATRKRPQRSYARPRTEQGVGFAGEWTADALFRNGEKTVSWAVPPGIPRSPDEGAKLVNQDWGLTSDRLSSAVARWLECLGLARSVRVREIKNTPDLQLTVGVHPEHQERALTEVGFGISQVLPILVAGLLLPKDALLVVDLPEAHLHPRPQALLADFFCSLALSGRRVLIETHSEMLFHRLRLRSEMHASLAKQIAVYFADQPRQDGLCAEPRPVGLSLDGELKWPAGFLEEALEAETSVRTVRDAKKATSRK